MKLRSVCVYCGSSLGHTSTYVDTARNFGKLLATRGIDLIYGGGNVGTMGALADGALKANGRVIGVIPHTLIEMDVSHMNLSELHTVDTMQQRKTKMAELADAFVALPGGIGTLEEIFEVITLTQLGFHSKPCAFLNTAGFYDSLLKFLKNVVEEGFIREAHMTGILVDDSGEELIRRLENYSHQTTTKRIERA